MILAVNRQKGFGISGLFRVCRCTLRQIVQELTIQANVKSGGLTEIS